MKTQEKHNEEEKEESILDICKNLQRLADLSEAKVNMGNSFNDYICDMTKARIAELEEQNKKWQSTE